MPVIQVKEMQHILKPGQTRLGAGPGVDVSVSDDASLGRLLLVDGVGMKSCRADPSFAANHPEQYTHNLTGANMVIKETSSYQKFWGGGPSVDQTLAATKWELKA